MAKRASGKVLDDTDDWGIQTSFQSFLFCCSGYIAGDSTRTYSGKAAQLECSAPPFTAAG
jgi:hypothetical protein